MRVLLVSGSSGGHIFPALALMNSLKINGAIVLLVLPKSKDSRIPVDCGDVEYINAAAFSFNLNSKNIYGVYSFLRGTWESLRIIIKFRPDVVVGFGSLNTVALLFWAWLFRVKTIIHEQNVIPGRANRLLARFVDRVAVSFAQTKEYLHISQEKAVTTGNPIRKELIKLQKKEAVDFFKFKEGKFNILIVGGSQGSHKINAVSFASLAALGPREDLQVIHISGAQEFIALEKSYAATGITHKLFDFLSAMQYAYSLADLVICRAGATTIAELQKFSLPAVLIPYSFAYGHQLNNAQMLADVGAAVVILDAELTVEKLKNRLEEFLRDPGKLILMRQAYEKIVVGDAANMLAKEVLSV
ncbi:undecaprenyldiphospho-muramoylpentapeptide beta-N-acetylglucosaminyltransferase [bacterium]|nr:MAG: undecaprenyldiphospho-muramoylpentapeptide beta-N-acetylglucosaminyltransferase [bacterium]